MTIRATPCGFMVAHPMSDSRGTFYLAGFGPTRLQALQDYLNTCRTLQLTGTPK